MLCVLICMLHMLDYAVHAAVRSGHDRNNVDSFVSSSVPQCTFVMDYVISKVTKKRSQYLIICCIHVCIYILVCWSVYIILTMLYFVCVCMQFRTLIFPVFVLYLKCWQSDCIWIIIKRKTVVVC